MAERLAAFERHYTWIDPRGLAYFRARLAQAPRDSEHALEVVTRALPSRREAGGGVAALSFKCDVLWACSMPSTRLWHASHEPRREPAPALAPHVRLRFDAARGEHVLLVPGGGLASSTTPARRSSELCDGQRTVAEIAAALQSRYDAGRRRRRARASWPISSPSGAGGRCHG